MVRQINFSNDQQCRAALTISAAMYERKALDCSSTLPLIVSLNNLAYLVANNRKIRDMVCVDGGLERLVRILRDVPRSPAPLNSHNRHRQVEGILPTWRWTTAFQCMVHLCIRGGIHVRERAVEAGVVPILVKVLESYLCFSDALRNDKKRAIEERKRNADRQKSSSSSSNNNNAGASADRDRDRTRSRQQQEQQSAPSTSHSQQARAYQHAQTLVAQQQDQQPADPVAVASSASLASPARAIPRPPTHGQHAPATHASRSSALEAIATPSLSPSQNTSASSSRTSSFYSQSGAEAVSQHRLANTRPPSDTAQASGSGWSHVSTTATLDSPSAVPSTLASSSSIPSTTSASAVAVPSSSRRSSRPPRPSRTTLGNVSSAEDLRDAVSASGSEEGAEDAEMSADGEESEADIPTITTVRARDRDSDFVRDVEAAAARAAEQSEDEPEERRTPRASRRTLAPLAVATRPTAIPAGPSSPADWVAQDTPRAPAMSSRSHTVTPRDVHRGEEPHPSYHASSSHHSRRGAEQYGGSGSNGAVSISSSTAHPHGQHQPQSNSHSHSSHSHHGHGRGDRHTPPARVRPVLPTTYIAETFDPSDMVFREEEVLLSLQILAYLTKYSHIRALLRFPEMTRASNMADLDDLFEKAQASPGTPMWQEGQTFQRSIYTIAERYTCRATRRDPNAEYIAGHHKLAPLIQYWAAVVMRNACRKDDRAEDARAGLRQCGNMLCGKWEKEPREFAKCRRCKKAKFCSKVCQSTSWQIGHKYWCSSLNEDADSERAKATRSSEQPESRRLRSESRVVEPATDGNAAMDVAAAVLTAEIAAAHARGEAAPQQPTDDFAVARSPTETAVTPTLANRPRVGSRAAEAHNSAQILHAPPGPSTHHRRLEQGNRVPMQRLPGTAPSAIPSRIVSEAATVGSTSDMSEDEGDRSRMMPPSDDNMSDHETAGMLRGPPAAPIRTDIAGRPLPPPVIAGTGMELAAAHALNGGDVLDPDDSFGDRFVGAMDEQFGQGNIDQIPWRGQTPTQDMDDERRRRLPQDLFHHQAHSNGGTTEGDTDSEEPSVSRRRSTITQAVFPNGALSALTAHRDQSRVASSSSSVAIHEEQQQQQRQQHHQHQQRTASGMHGLQSRMPGLGLPSHLASGGNRSASAMHPMVRSVAGSDPVPEEVAHSVRRVPSSDHPSLDQSRHWYGEQGPRTTAAESPGPLGSWVEPGNRDGLLQRRTMMSGQHGVPMNHHQHLLMRGELAAGMMGRSATPSSIPTSGGSGSAGIPSMSRYSGTSSTLSSPAGREDAHRLMLDEDRMADQRTPPSSRSYEGASGDQQAAGYLGGQQTSAAQGSAGDEYLMAFWDMMQGARQPHMSSQGPRASVSGQTQAQSEDVEMAEEHSA